MTESFSRNAFFSFAHADRESSPNVFTALTSSINSTVNLKISTFSFSIWWDQQIQFGDIWDKAIRDRLTRADFLIILLSPTWLDREYCRNEYRIFKSVGGGRIFPILFEPIDKNEVQHFAAEKKEILDEINSLQRIEFGRSLFRSGRNKWEPVIETLAESITQSIFSTARQDEVTSEDGRQSREMSASLTESLSLPGILSFDEMSKDLFIGRRDEVITVGDRLDTGFAAVIGPSGSGKTSLLQAGVVPEWRKRHAAWVPITLPLIRPGNDPFRALATALNSPDAETASRTFFNVKNHAVLNAVKALCATRKSKRILLVVEQFEELFRLDHKTQGAFVDVLIDLVKWSSQKTENQDPSRQRIYVALSLRADMLHEILQFPQMQRFLQAGLVLIGEPDRGTLTDIIDGMSKRMLFEIGEEFRDEIIQEIVAAGSGKLALLGVTMQVLYARRTSENILLETVYEDFGGAAGVIASQATIAFEGFTPIADKDQLLRRLFAELVEKESDGPASRRQAVVSSLTTNNPDMSDLIGLLSQPHVGFITKSGDLIEVIHEIVFRRFSLYNDWIQTNVEELSAAAAVEKGAREWARRGTAESLWPPGRLKQAAAVIRASPEIWASLSAAATAFLNPVNYTEALYKELEDDRTRNEQRIEIGHVLNDLTGGDPRRGTGLRSDGFPDVLWQEVPDSPRLALQTERREPYVGSVKPFFMAQYPVTCAQYRAFLSEAVYNDPRWWTNGTKAVVNGEGGGNEPVTRVFFAQAVAFSRWADTCWPIDIPGGRREGWHIRLPTEWEWLQAATGSGDSRFPWNGPNNPGRARSARHDLDRLGAIPVGLFPRGKSPFGIFDLVGNVQEFCLNPFKPAEADDSLRALRGGVIDTSTPSDGQGTCGHRASLFRRYQESSVSFRLVYGPGDSARLATLTIREWARGA